MAGVVSGSGLTEGIIAKYLDRVNEGDYLGELFGSMIVKL